MVKGTKEVTKKTTKTVTPKKTTTKKVTKPATKKTPTKKAETKVKKERYVSFIPILAIIVTEIVTFMYSYNQARMLLTANVPEKEVTSLAVKAFGNVSCIFILFNAALLCLAYYLYKKNWKYGLYISEALLLLYAILVFDLNVLYATIVPLVVGAYYIYKIRKES